MVKMTESNEKIECIMLEALFYVSNRNLLKLDLITSQLGHNGLAQLKNNSLIQNKLGDKIKRPYFARQNFSSIDKTTKSFVIC